MRNLDRMRITDAIRRLLTSDAIWSTMDPFTINNGDCEDFQQDAIRVAGLDGAVTERCTENLPEPLAGRLPGHCWIFHDGRHYDAECPDGVARPEDLPIFARATRARRHTA